MAPPTDLGSVARKLATEGPHKTLATPRHIQILFNGVYVVRTTRSLFVWEHPYYPQLYIPADAFSHGLHIEPGESYKTDDGKEVATQLVLRVGERSTDRVVRFSDDLVGTAEVLKGMVKIEFAAMDQWFEESTPIHIHPKDPFKRVDILSSTRPIRVRVDGKVVAETSTSMHLYETGLPVRFYLPLTSIDPSVLRKSAMVTECPYKGKAEYYSVEVNGKVYENIVWYYNQPLMESAKVEGLCCFYNEKVEIELDGEVLEQPKTHFKPPKKE